MKSLNKVSAGNFSELQQKSVMKTSFVAVKKEELSFISLTSGNLVTNRANSFNPAFTGPERCQITKCSRLLNSTYTDTSSYTYFSVKAHIFGLHN